jgi:hypothetical protein
MMRSIDLFHFTTEDNMTGELVSTSSHLSIYDSSSGNSISASHLVGIL